MALSDNIYMNPNNVLILYILVWNGKNNQITFVESLWELKKNATMVNIVAGIKVKLKTY